MCLPDVYLSSLTNMHICIGNNAHVINLLPKMSTHRIRHTESFVTIRVVCSLVHTMYTMVSIFRYILVLALFSNILPVDVWSVHLCTLCSLWFQPLGTYWFWLSIWAPPVDSNGGGLETTWLVPWFDGYPKQMKINVYALSLPLFEVCIQLH